HGHDAAADAHALKDEDEEEQHHGPVEPHESPWTMTVPLVVLAVLSTLGGLVGVPYALSSLVGVKNDVNVFEHTLEPTVFHASEGSAERLLTLVSVAVALLGIGVGWFWFQRRPLYEMPRLLENKYYVDEIYDAALIRPVEEVSREGLWKFFDVGVIDGIVNGVGRGTRELGAILR